jgi:hypothetical protein
MPRDQTVSSDIKRLNQKLFSVIIYTGKTFKGGWDLLPVLILLKKNFGSISLCVTTQFDLFIH